MASQLPEQRRFAFIFGMASGHINPSFPVARTLIRQGHEVHYMCREQMREPIEHTGARFHDEIASCPEMYEGREPDIFGALESLKKEYGLEQDVMMVCFRKLSAIVMELQMPGHMRFLQELKPDVVVCCPLMNKAAVQAAKILNIPCVSLLTTAGPGSMHKAMDEFIRSSGMSLEEIRSSTQGFEPHLESLKRFEDTYGIKLNIDDGLQPLGVMDSIKDSTLTLVTTCEDLQDPTTEEMDAAYAESIFEAVGPLLDEQGATRAAGHKFKNTDPGAHSEKSRAQSEESPLVRLQEARAAGRKVVLVSMGTVITGDSPDFGWDAKPREGAGGVPQGLTGRELCQAAWAGAFDAFGASGADTNLSPLLLVALGPQDRALGDLQVPDNALCMPVLPQVDILKAGVDLFLTHGGQNSFTEALSEGVPVVVCPGFGDQKVNARKAVTLGVGLQVERPVPEDGKEADAAKAYRESVESALHEVLSDPRFARAARSCEERLQLAGGVPRAVELILSLADGETAKSATPALPTLLTRGKLQAAEKDGRAAENDGLCMQTV